MSGGGAHLETKPEAAVLHSCHCRWYRNRGLFHNDRRFDELLPAISNRPAASCKTTGVVSGYSQRWRLKYQVCFVRTHSPYHVDAPGRSASGSVKHGDRIPAAFKEYGDIGGIAL